MALRHTKSSTLRTLRTLVSLAHLVNVFSDRSARTAERNAGRAKHQMQVARYDIDKRLHNITSADRKAEVQIATTSRVVA